MPEYPAVIRHQLGPGHGSAFIEIELNPYGEGRCPECGVDLTTVNVPAEVGRHWSDEPLPVIHENYLARARKAYMLGQELPKE